MNVVNLGDFLNLKEGVSPKNINANQSSTSNKNDDTIKPEDKKEYLLFLIDKAQIEIKELLEKLNSIQDYMLDSAIFGDLGLKVEELEMMFNEVILPVLRGETIYQMDQEEARDLRRGLIRSLASKYKKEFITIKYK